MNWKSVLTDQEKSRIAELARERSANKAEYRRIYDRCRKRLTKEQNAPTQKAAQNTAKTPCF